MGATGLSWCLGTWQQELTPVLSHLEDRMASHYWSGWPGLVGLGLRFVHDLPANEWGNRQG